MIRFVPQSAFQGSCRFRVFVGRAMKSFRTCMLLSGVSCLWGGLGLGCSASTPLAAPLEVVVATEVASLDPRWATRALDVKLTRLVHAGLVGLDPDTLEPRPLLAESLNYLDERTLDVELRRDVRFHSGKVLTADDVCSTLRALAEPALRSPHRVVVASLGDCLVKTPRRLELRLREPRATLLTDLEVPILRGDQAQGPPRPEGDLDGLGPYRVAQATTGVVLLEPMANGLQPRPKYSLVVRTVRDENARALRLMAGRTDVAPNAISPTLLPALEQRGLAVVARSGANLTYLLMQNDREPFRDVEVRRAVAQAIDRALIVRTLFSGKAQPADWVFPPGHWARPAALPSLGYDPVAAGSRLKGLKPVKLLTSTDRSRLTLARVMAQMLGDAGLVVEVVALELGALLSRLDAGDYDLACLQMPELTEPNLLSWFFHPRGIPGEGGEGRNRSRYRSAHAGELLDLGSRLAGREARRRVYGELAFLMQQDMPIVPLWHEDQVAVVSPRAAGFTISAEGRWLGLSRL